ncbi:M4 family metallopeptidase [Actinoplanes sp. TRM 88003]|uniref:M4 family metallopeptidase n=1 Tax=Paractinoplanes aksuensis TaxID=2939490 RepID=A0ABT1DMI5_9ACTN|nr:M4 family metallopeptidase [Actinoplanes aksuensis]MCO8271723.1 M4 family metallopeptidase [Actinoplanes aksuensis]
MRVAVALAGAIALVSGSLVVTATNVQAAPVTPGSSLLDQAGSAIKKSGLDRYAVHSSKKGTVRYTRTYDGLRVAGGDLVIRTRSDGTYAGSSVGLTRPLTLATKPSVTADKAAATAKGEFEGSITSTGKPELFVDATSGLGKLAWETVITGWQPDRQTPSRFHVISDALSGAVIGSYDEIEHVAGTGNSIYSGEVAVESTAAGASFNLVDPTRGGGLTCDMNNRTSGACATFTDADNTWGTGAPADRQSAAVDAHFGAAVTFDYFKGVHGRNGIFGDGRGVPSRVHYGSNYVNAFWDGAQMTYGDGTGNAKPLVALDVAGHEMSHGVTENVVPGGLTYSGESGGLNEATSDIFGSMVEFHADTTADAGDYDIGEKIDINGNGSPLRYMYNPTLDGRSHGCWSTSTRSVDVHYSSGVANHFFFNLAEGSGATPYGTSPLCGAADPVTGIGQEKAAKIWFRALDSYFVSNTGYVNTANPGNTARAYSLSAAGDLYGFCSAEYKAVQTAWTSVNVAGTDEQCSTGNDFSVTLAPAAVALGPGESATVTATTALVNGEAEPVTFTAGATPAGVTVTFEPATVTAGESTTITVSADATAARSSGPVRITATAPSVTRTRDLAVTVNSGAKCAGTNATVVPIPDNSTVTSSITVDGCTAAPSTTSGVEVHIRHTYIGDLVVSLVAPDGSAYVLHNRAEGSTDNIDKTYSVNLAGETADGTWTLRVQDAANLDTGSLTSWTLSL